MNEENRLNNPQWEEEETSIDFKALFGALKKHWKNYAICIPAAVIIGAVITKSLPPY